MHYKTSVEPISWRNANGGQITLHDLHSNGATMRTAKGDEMPMVVERVIKAATAACI